MDFKKNVILTGLIFLSLVIIPAVFAEESAATAPAAPVDQQATPKNENDIQWAWGEVTNLDAQAKTLTLKYLDYETDQEKELILTTDEKTVFENIKSFDEIKINDTLSIDYTAGTDGKNVAKNISLEKKDVLPSATVQTAETAQPAEVTAPVQKQAIEPVAPAVATETPAVQPPAAPAPVAQDTQAQQ